MKNKIIFGILLVVVFVVSKIAFANMVIVNPQNMNLTVGIGALVVGYFVNRIVKGGLFKAEEKA